MARRVLRLALVLGLALCPAGGRSSASPQDPPPFVVWGRVDVVSGPNQTLLILVDQETGDHPADGVVDLAFRLQQAPAVTFSGHATVTYVKNRVAIAVTDQVGWLFTVAGRVAQAVPSDGVLREYEVLGLSRFWGQSVQTTPAVLAERLLSRFCGADPLTAGGSPLCEECEVGGPGVRSCSIDCGDDSCGADCADNQFACCNCPLGCACCPINPGATSTK
jgi:hypothetical protein